MGQISTVNTPFDQFDTDTQSVDSTGAALSAIFTNLAFTKCREIILQNRGSADLLIGKSLAAAKYHILPGTSLNLAPKDISTVFVKSAGATLTVDILLVV